MHLVSPDPFDALCLLVVLGITGFSIACQPIPSLAGIGTILLGIVAWPITVVWRRRNGVSSGQ